MDSFRQEKVQRFKEVFELVLKSDLDRVIDGRNKVFEEQKVLLYLRREIQDLQGKSVTSVNVGFEADVPDAQHISMDIGLGICVDLTFSEALEFILLREAKLARKIRQYTWLIHFFKGQMKLGSSYFNSEASCKGEMYPCQFHEMEEGHWVFDNHFYSDEGHEVDDPFAEHEFMFRKTSEKMNSEARPSISHAFKGIHIR